ncbi:MAG: transketolase [Candidatus Doudnabacteria bacterium RIFCSPHIGHO2_02_FULL_46_11]|uniref:Transketolase n=1 Tax=Candidatus Doudnabacteria bacterium RIFCSPHIGHO2_02_FULL_46_11 TaxID=1817832 RepID=A0A1F5P5J5_9BACT|nr:MAG: transketolase [Candidatus Doudnabacteria bacterium RIFCSPHIGHO2_02_FULL_46_11]
MKQKSELEIKIIASEIRQSIIEMLLEAKSGHSAGPLGMTDIFASLYFNILKHDPQNPKWEDRDKVMLSNGHICPVLYATLAHAGYFPKEELKTLRKLGTRLHGHPHNLVVPGVENSSGPLGQGLSQAIGAALADRIDKKRRRIFCLMSDGEHDEGQTWEAIMFAGKMKLSNVTSIVDRNNIQIEGYTENIMPLEPFADKYKAFNWHVLEIDGHNIEQIIDACAEADAIYEKPTVIIAHTIPGKGVNFMEKDYHWHGTPPNVDQANEALKQIRTLEGKIESEHE